jgi:hypothetical protein
MIPAESRDAAPRDRALTIDLVVRYNTPVVVVRRTSGSDTRTDMKAVVDSEKIFLQD